MSGSQAEKSKHRMGNPVRWPKLLSVEEAAEYLQMSASSIRHLYYAHIVPIVRLSKKGKIWLDKEDLDEWVEEQKEYA